MTKLEEVSGITIPKKKWLLRHAFNSVVDVTYKTTPQYDRNVETLKKSLGEMFLSITIALPLFLIIWFLIIGGTLFAFDINSYNPTIGILVSFLLSMPILVVLILIGIILFNKSIPFSYKKSAPYYGVSLFLSDANPPYSKIAVSMAVILFITWLPFPIFVDLIYDRLYMLFIENLPMVEMIVKTIENNKTIETLTTAPGVPDQVIISYIGQGIFLMCLIPFGIYSIKTAKNTIVEAIQTWYNFLSNMEERRRLRRESDERSERIRNNDDY